MVVVTGAASGIGHALAVALVARGDIVTLADLDHQKAARIAEYLGSRHPGHTTAASVDVQDATAVQEMIQAVKDEHGRIDLMFNNAGIAVVGPAEEHSLDHWNRAIDVNLRGVVHGVHAVYPIMLEQGSGHIVNTASLAGLVPAPFKLAYTTTKYAVVGLSLALRSEAAGHGVRVSVICPGYVDTPLLDNVNPGLPQPNRDPQSRAQAIRQQGRLYAPDQLAHDVLRGIDHNQAMIIAPAKARFAWRISRYAPSFALRAAVRMHR